MRPHRSIIIAAGIVMAFVATSAVAETGVSPYPQRSRVTIKSLDYTMPGDLRNDIYLRAAAPVAPFSITITMVGWIFTSSTAASPASSIPAIQYETLCITTIGTVHLRTSL